MVTDNNDDKEHGYTDCPGDYSLSQIIESVDSICRDSADT